MCFYLFIIFQVSRPDPEEVVLGQEGEFWCELVNPAETVTACQIVDPAGEVLNVDNGQVTDSTGSVIPGYLPNDRGDAAKVCGITMTSLQFHDLG